MRTIACTVTDLIGTTTVDISNFFETVLFSLLNRVTRAIVLIIEINFVQRCQLYGCAVCLLSTTWQVILDVTVFCTIMS
jgi:hypothetical protein